MSNSHFQATQFTSWSTQRIESKATRPQPKGLHTYICTHSLLGYSNSANRAGSEKCALSTLLPGKGKQGNTWGEFSSIQQNRATNVVSCSVGIAKEG